MDAQNMIQDAIRNGGASQLLFVSAADLREVVKNMANDIAEQFQPKREEKYLTTKQAAKLLSVDMSTLYRWDNENYLKSVRLGSKRRYRLSDIEKLMEVRQ